MRGGNLSSGGRRGAVPAVVGGRGRVRRKPDGALRRLRGERRARAETREAGARAADGKDDLIDGPGSLEAGSSWDTRWWRGWLELDEWMSGGSDGHDVPGARAQAGGRTGGQVVNLPSRLPLVQGSERVLGGVEGRDDELGVHTRRG